MALECGQLGLSKEQGRQLEGRERQERQEPTSLDALDWHLQIEIVLIEFMVVKFNIFSVCVTSTRLPSDVSLNCTERPSCPHRPPNPLLQGVCVELESAWQSSQWVPLRPARRRVPGARCADPQGVDDCAAPVRVRRDG